MFFVVLVKPMYQTKLWKTTTKAYRKYRVVILYKPKDQKFTLNLYWSMSNIWNRGLIVWNFRFGLPFASLFLAALVRWMLLKFARSKFYCQKKQTKRWELCEKKQGMICGENDNAPYWTMLHVVFLMRILWWMQMPKENHVLLWQSLTCHPEKSRNWQKLDT